MSGEGAIRSCVVRKCVSEDFMSGDMSQVRAKAMQITGEKISQQDW